MLRHLVVLDTKPAISLSAVTQRSLAATVTTNGNAAPLDGHDEKQEVDETSDAVTPVTETDTEAGSVTIGENRSLVVSLEVENLNQVRLSIWALF